VRWWSTSAFHMVRKTKTSAVAQDKVESKPPTPSPAAKVPAPLQRQLICLASADFICSETSEVCGRVWVVTSNLELARIHGGAPLPVFQEEHCPIHVPLGVIIEKSFVWAYVPIGTELTDLSQLLEAIRTVDANRLHAIDPDYAPFFCPKCNKCYASSIWSATTIFVDRSYYDHYKVKCPIGHESKIWYWQSGIVMNRTID
jgi:hypothetical protein